jgi:CheY-like chemotaxis protein/anti-sigma regulatory factor (Ser/Thr protein kinase)
MVKAAPTELHQILMNLVTNALQALDADGVVTVRTRVEDITTPYQARTGILGPGTFLRLDVSDTGHGIAPEAVGRIFEPFFTTKPAGAGTGLGLSLVQQLVDELGGAIDVVTRVNSGTTFTVFLPCELRGGTPQPAGETVIRGQGETILLVDDEVALVELGEELLAALGYEPVGFSSSQAAWEAFQRTPHRFDALLTDETMPEHSGTELARLVHSLRADLPIVIMSGYVAPERAEQMQLLGIRHVMRKPLAASELSRTLARALQKRAAAVSE